MLSDSGATYEVDANVLRFIMEGTVLNVGWGFLTQSGKAALTNP